MMNRPRRAALPLIYQQRNTRSPLCLTPWLVSLAAVAANETTIHHRPTVSSGAVTDKANRINKALAQALLVCTQTSFLLQISSLFSPHTLNFLCNFLFTCAFLQRRGGGEGGRFAGDIIYLQLTATTANIIFICHLLCFRWTCSSTVWLSALTGNLGKKEREREKPLQIKKR